MTASPAPVPGGGVPCPRCGRAVAPDQDWCLACGAAARTRLAPTPNWRLPIAVVAVVAALACAALVLAFVALTDDGGSPAGPVTPAGAPAANPAGATGPTVPGSAAAPVPGAG